LAQAVAYGRLPGVRSRTPRYGEVVVGLTLLCVSGCGGSSGLDELCAVPAMPATTPAQIKEVRARIEAVFQQRQPVYGSDRNKRIFKAAISVQQSADHALFLAEARASGRGALASEVTKDLGKGTGFTLTDLPQAQSELRAACRG
jgi:hypothetical protein